MALFLPSFSDGSGPGGADLDQASIKDSAKSGSADLTRI